MAWGGVRAGSHSLTIQKPEGTALREARQFLPPGEVGARAGWRERAGMWAPAGLTASIATPSSITLTGPRTQKPQSKEAYSCGSLDTNFHLGHLSLYPLLKGVLLRSARWVQPSRPGLPASYSSFLLPLHLVPCLASVLIAHSVLFNVPLCLHFPACTIFSRRRG